MEVGIRKVAAPGTSLAVQWLTLGTSIAGGVGSIPGWGTKIPQAVRCGQKIGKKKKKRLRLVSYFELMGGGYLKAEGQVLTPGEHRCGSQGVIP